MIKHLFLEVTSLYIKRECATSGFFEEIVLFAIVSILFVSTLTVAVYYGSTKDAEYRKTEFVNEVINFAQKVRGYEPLIHDSVEGLFDYHKIKGVSSDELSKDLTPAFNYYIEVIDVSDYPIKYNASWSNVPGVTGTTVWQQSYGYYRVVFYYPVNIWVSDHEIHAAKLEVVGWR